MFWDIVLSAGFLALVGLTFGLLGLWAWLSWQDHHNTRR